MQDILWLFAHSDGRYLVKNTLSVQQFWQIQLGNAVIEIGRIVLLWKVTQRSLMWKNMKLFGIISHNRGRRSTLLFMYKVKFKKVPQKR